jgi:hypothetical protein
MKEITRSLWIGAKYLHEHHAFGLVMQPKRRPSTVLRDISVLTNSLLEDKTRKQI